MDNNVNKKYVAIGAIAVIIALVLVVALYMFIPHWYSGFAYDFHSGGWLWAAGILLIIVGSIAALVLFELQKPILSVIFGVLALALIPVIVFPSMYSTASATVNNQPIQYEALDESWQVRAPIDTAHAQARFAVGDNPNANLIDHSLRYVPENAEYSNLTHTRGIFKHYSQVVQQSSDLVGTNVPEVCEFDTEAAPLWLGGLVNSLGRKIVNEPGHRMSTYDQKDAYGYCEDDIPMVVVPLYKAEGSWWNSRPVPDGVAVYNGSTGDLEVHDSGEDIPGPTLPRVVAERSVTANRTEGGMMDWFFNRYGYRTTNDEGTNIVLATEDDGSGMFVSKLAPARDTEGDDPTSAIAKISAVSPNRGELPEVTIERLGDRSWRPDSAIDAKIRNDYSNLPNWQEFSIHEIIPVDAHHFVATIGNNQNVRYRVIGRGDLGTLEGQPEGVSTCLFEGTSDEPLQCGQRAGRDGNSVGIEYEDDSDASVSDPSGELGEMSTQELIDSTRALLDELERRNDQ